MREVRCYTPRDVLDDITQRAIDDARRDSFWDFYTEELVAFGYDREYIEAEMERYKKTAQLWEKGETDFQRVLLNKVIIPILEG